MNGAVVNNHALNGGAEKQLIEVSDNVTFELLIDDAVKFTKVVYNRGVFRLPMGYKSDNAQIRVSSGLRVREVDLAETPIGLEKI